MAAAAAKNADAVDRDARFPAEAFLAAREQRLLDILVPADLGGEGASISDVVDVCYVLGRVLRVDRHDLCDAPDHGCNPGASRSKQPMASASASPAFH